MEHSEWISGISEIPVSLQNNFEERNSSMKCVERSLQEVTLTIEPYRIDLAIPTALVRASIRRHFLINPRRCIRHNIMVVGGVDEAGGKGVLCSRKK